MMGYRTHLLGQLIVMSENLSPDIVADSAESVCSSSTTDNLLNENTSTMTITHQCLNLISTCIFIAVSNTVPGFAVKTLNSTNEVVTITLTPADLGMHQDVKNFMLFACINAKLTVSEMIHVLFLFESYTKNEGASLSQTSSKISKGNLGSVL
jgi:hypothetical protein